MFALVATVSAPMFLVLIVLVALARISLIRCCIAALL